LSKELDESAKPVIGQPPGNSRIWSKMGIRAVYGQSLLELRKTNDRIFAISADLGRSSGLARFAEEYPGSYLSVGIAEQTLISVAAGISRSGRAVFASTFAPFATLRAGEFMRLEMGYMQKPVTVVGLGSGISLGYLGNSHYGLEDVGVVRSLSGIDVYSPADASEMITTLAFLSSNPSPSYVRLTGAPQSPPLFDSPSDVQNISFSFFGKSGGKLIVSTGATSGHIREALGLTGVNASDLEFGFLHVNQIKPIAREALDIIGSASALLVLDEHFDIGGLSSAITDSVRASGSDSELKIETVNLGHTFPKQGSYKAGLDRNLLSTSHLSTRLNEFLGS
jgi:transketolase